MKKTVLIMWAMLLTLTLQAQNKAPEDMVVIEQQPEGSLYIYNREGYAVREKKVEPEDPDNPYYLHTEKQTGTINIVFGKDNKVYMFQPLSNLVTYDGWIEGTLSEDGRTITVPMMQYIGYTKSFDMAVQVAMFRLDTEKNTYVFDESVKEITYTISEDGTIKQNGTSKNLILGAMNRAFGDTFTYLDYEWIQEGDYASTYTLFTEEPLSVPEGLETESFYLTTCEFDGSQWRPITLNCKLGFDGDDAYLQGIFEYMPMAWIKGKREGNTVTFPTKQFMGTYVQPIFFKGARINNNVAEESDVVFTFDGNDTYTTTDYTYITTDKDDFVYFTYYMGLTVSKHKDTVLNITGLETEEYVFSYRSNIGEEGAMEDGSNTVEVAFEDKNIYIKGLWEGLPEAWVKGYIEGDKLVFDLPQYLGMYNDEYLGLFPMYLTAFDDKTGVLKPQVSFDYNAEDKSFNNHDCPLSIGINKTGYLGIQDYYKGAFVSEALSVKGIESTDAGVESIYDAQGARLNTLRNGLNILKMNDGTVRKVMK